MTSAFACLMKGFRKADLKVVVDDSGRITVRGTQRPRFARVDQSFKAPQDSDLDKITGRFENDHLALIIPKAASFRPEKDDKPAKAEEEEAAAAVKMESVSKKTNEPSSIKEKAFEELIPRRRCSTTGGRLEEREGRERRMALKEEDEGWLHWLGRSARSRNGQVMAVAVAAFSVGFYVSHKLRT
ncbi:hypothetical protein AXF42_Ash014829 [Apostasia shenzhenica]|uniref:SHSP domain-containing protein n=1 Tax=Apostasia shenzhenica TaxID=1088818 RepID=A0A2H9ZWJ2_9ASPA|nr:hypothetical protein AXF42_Ash014829 [Apostasia shenzhenica]